MKNSALRAIAAAAVVVLAGIAVIVVGRDAFSEDDSMAPVIALEPSAGTPVYTLDPEGTLFPPGTPVYVVGPDGTPVVHIPHAPHPDAAVAMTAAAEDNLKPVFTGVLNGITFIGMGTPQPGGTQTCADEDVEAVSGPDARLVLADAEFGYEVTWLPEGMELTGGSAVWCPDEVNAIGLGFTGEEGRTLSVVRIRTSPVAPYSVPRDRMEPMTIGGRPSVLIAPLPSGPTFIFMRDEAASLWTLSGFGFDRHEVLRFAEGIVSR